MTKRTAVVIVIAEMTAHRHLRKGSQADPALLPIAQLPVRLEPPRSALVNRDMADISTGTAMASAVNSSLWVGNQQSVSGYASVE